MNDPAGARRSLFLAVQSAKKEGKCKPAQDGIMHGISSLFAHRCGLSGKSLFLAELVYAKVM